MSASTSPPASSLQLSLPSATGSSGTVDSWREDDLRRALRHHARALRALRGSAYETLSETTRRQLIDKLENDWDELKKRLRSIQSPSGGDGASPGASSTPSSDTDDVSWTQYVTPTLT
ncbi:MAG: hypothetical protein GVY25_00765 [Bacteroidetes bacterium]|nr:hypothetical protein [Bacteroidota bacterium]